MFCTSVDKLLNQFVLQFISVLSKKLYRVPNKIFHGWFKFQYFLDFQVPYESCSYKLKPCHINLIKQFKANKMHQNNLILISVDQTQSCLIKSTSNIGSQLATYQVVNFMVVVYVLKLWFVVCQRALK
jgi:hypothetical protein